MRKVAIQPFAAVGALVIVTATPACGFSTLKDRLEIEVVPAGIRLDRFTVVVVLAVPAHTRFNWPRAQLDAAPGNSGATWAVIAAVTAIPLIVVGALVAQLHCAGQFVVPPCAQLPMSRVDTSTAGTVAFQDILMFGATLADEKSVRLTLKIATQLLAALGVWVRVMPTPTCGLLTVNANPEIAVVPACRLPAILIELLFVAVPPHTRFKLPVVQ